MSGHISVYRSMIYKSMPNKLGVDKLKKLCYRYDNVVIYSQMAPIPYQIHSFCIN